MEAAEKGSPLRERDGFSGKEARLFSSKSRRRVRDNKASLRVLHVMRMCSMRVRANRMRPFHQEKHANFSV